MAIAAQPQSVAVIPNTSLAGRGKLLVHRLPVHGPIDRAEDADRRRPGRALGEVGEREREARVLTTRIVNEQALDADVGDVHDLDPAV